MLVTGVLKGKLGLALILSYVSEPVCLGLWTVFNLWILRRHSQFVIFLGCHFAVPGTLVASWSESELCPDGDLSLNSLSGPIHH